MSVIGPGGKPPGVGGTTGPQDAGATGPTEGTGFVDKLAEADKTAPSAAPSGGDPIAALARQVEAGTMTGKQAVDQLMDMTLKGAQVPEAAKAQLRAKLEALLGDSGGFIGDKARGLGYGGKEE